MGELFGQEPVDEAKLPKELADEPAPGICLERGFMPPGIVGESLVYRPASGVTEDGQLIPPPPDSIDFDGRVLKPVEIVVVDLREPDIVLKEAGAYVPQADELGFINYSKF